MGLTNLNEKAKTKLILVVEDMWGGACLSLLLDDDADIVRLNSVGDVAGTPHKGMKIYIILKKIFCFK